MHKHSRTVERAHSNAEIVWGVDPKQIEAVASAYRAWFVQANRVRDEAVRFTQDRFEKELEAAVRLARCSNPADAFTLQADFANRMAADYLAEGQKMVELMGAIAKDVVSSAAIDSTQR